MDWHSIHVHYYADDRDPLILHGVRPLFEHLRRDVEKAFFLRHWRQGPHLRLNLRCAEGTLERSVRPAVHETIGRFLRERPSTRAVDPERHLPTHRRLAELESEPGPLLPWYPDNSIRYTSFDRRRHVLEGADVDLLIDFYVDTNELAFRMLDGIDRGRDRYRAAFDLMISTAHALSAVGIVRGCVSFRSHAEAFLNGYPEGRGLRRRWDDHYSANATALVEQVRRVVATLDGTDEPVSRGPVPYVRDWVTALTPYQSQVRTLIETGRLSLPSPQSVDAGRPATRTLGEASSFHRELLAAPAWARMREAEWFASYRLMLNYTYLQLTRLGISPAERFLLCHLAANAVEDAFGVSALDVVRGLRVDATAGPGGEPS